MKRLQLDIETFSSEPLQKCGVYRYASAEDFAVLLFGYSVDGGDVQVIDLAQGEKIPTNVLAALEDRNIVKWSFNSNFERVCLSRYLGYPMGDYLDPSSWRCTMVWSAYMGLPLSLEGAGAVLGLEKQKLVEGKDLIKYFCQPCVPTKANGERTRNLPGHAPDKWAAFKAYNLRDVEAEMQITQRLSKFPVPDFVWDEYHLSEEINDRGIGVDMPFVKQAIAFDEKSRSRLSAAMRDITELDNPQSVQQMKAWLVENGLETDTLDKKTVAELLKDAPGNLSEVLLLRQQLAKTSVKKYTAMESAVCSDGRLHGMYRFYGANRTGRWCLTGDHEILTRQGWRKIASSFNGKPEIAVFDSESGDVRFEKSKIVSFNYSGNMYLWESKRVAQFSTPEHRNLITDSHGVGKIRFVADIPSKAQLPVAGQLKSNIPPRFTDSELRLLVAYQADGISAGGARNGIAFRFTKERKIQRMRELLISLKYPFREYKHSDGATCIRVRANNYNPSIKSKQFGWWLLNENADVFFDELGHWDGHIQTDMSVQYVTTNRLNAEIVSTYAHLSGRAAIINPRQVPEGKNHSMVYYVEVWNNVSAKGVYIPDAPKLVHEYACTVYCAETSTGFFVVRRDKKIWITGNSSKTINIQNLPQNHVEDLAEARLLVRSGNYDALEMLYEDIPDTLSQLIRTAFVPQNGRKFIVADFSAIEARVISWFAKEQWKSDAFAKGEDIYCATASQMFHVPVEKHGVNGELRQKGKIAELACIAEGQLVLTDYGLIPIEKVTTDMRVWDGESWVRHDGVVFRGEREVIEYDGLTATTDHLVWIEGQPEPVQFGTAASGGKHLLQAGNGRARIQPGKNHNSKTVSLIKPDRDNTGCGNSSIRETKELVTNKRTARLYDIRNAGPHHRFTVSGVLVHNCGYGGSVGALRAMGALEMGLKESELQPIVDSWRGANPNIVKFWWAVDRAAKAAVKGKTHTTAYGIRFSYQSGFLFITLPSGRRLAYVKPRIEENRFGGEAITYEGTGGTKKWERLETYGPKLVENIVQATARDILCYAMQTLRCCSIVMHIHDEVVIEADPHMSLEAVCAQMSRTPPWASGLILRADGYECDFYKKD